jgi:riboflavin kinase/FMN adenylyltransferase
VQVIKAFGEQWALDSSCLITFWPHPQSILFPDQSPKLLMSIDHKLHAFTQLDIAYTLIVPFDNHFSTWSAQQFLDSIETSFPNLERLSVGENFRFGNRREGTTDTLKYWCHQHGIDFRCPELVLHEDEPISSSRIRTAILAGDLEHASEMLGYPYELFGQVIQGDGRGRTLGIPTANLKLDSHILPPEGVYAGKTIIDHVPYRSAINIGSRPTIEEHGESPPSELETHVIDFDGDLYGQNLIVQPIKRLRSQTKFDTPEELKDQITHDIQQVRDLEF